MLFRHSVILLNDIAEEFFLKKLVIWLHILYYVDLDLVEELF